MNHVPLLPQAFPHRRINDDLGIELANAVQKKEAFPASQKQQHKQRKPVPTEAFYPKITAGTDTDSNPILSTEAPEFLTLKELDTFADTLAPEVQGPLYNTHGKPHKNISFTGEYRFRHIIPHLIHSKFLDNDSAAALDNSSLLASTMQAVLSSRTTDLLTGVRHRVSPLERRAIGRTKKTCAVIDEMTHGNQSASTLAKSNVFTFTRA